MAMHEKHMMPGGKMMKGKMPAPMPPTAMKPMMKPADMKPTMGSQKPATNPALAKLPTQAKGYGVRGGMPPTKKGKK